jgi:hypothetical protein
VSVSVALLLLDEGDEGSVVPAGVAIDAVFDTLPDAEGEMLAFTVMVTLPPEGSVGITIPEPCINATVVFPTVGQAAPPVAEPQVTLVTLIQVAAGSVNTALLAGDGPLLETTIV